MTDEQIHIISEALTSACNYLYDNLDVICDKTYYEETQNVLTEIEHAIEIIKNANKTNHMSS